MLRYTRVLRSGTARTLMFGLMAGALLAACDPRTPNQNEPLPDERNPDPQAPPAGR